jgi:peptidoglycan LD-endopeptidase CwlK
VSRDINDLRPEVRAAAARAIDELVKRGIPFAVTATLRSAEEQAALYAQGRRPLEEVNALRSAAGLAPLPARENGYTVTMLDGRKTALGGTGRSIHQLGGALDVVPTDSGRPVWPPASDPRWAEIAAVFEAEGFEWGGRWTDFPDRPHYQMEA